MPIPELTFLILHAPFIFVYLVLLRVSKSNVLSRKVFWVVFVSYVVTAVSYYLDLGDDFANFQYGALFWLTPLVYYFLRVRGTEATYLMACLKVLAFSLMHVFLTVVFLFLALLYDPPEF
ncbi:hypothetical protein [Acanthopleuribacter pedis]|uniref:Uncharacterized protein n=1 Tax=Acanthopleuribacter pedis TaxID=442870 RepID=A0A8J7QD44_9BACT|nr:hypothetical protein [Acanthopleuribacter pedis]MBO1322332.1 hypothetical protein [Acanthopleuribacter pedis]